MIEALHDRLARVQFNPGTLTTDDLDAMTEIARHPEIAMSIRLSIGIFAAAERRRRESSDPDLIEPSYLTIDLIGMDAKQLSETLHGAFTLMLSTDSMPDRVGSLVALLVQQIVGASRARLERGF